MLELASLHKEKLITMYRKTWRNPKYRFYSLGVYFEDLTIEDSTWGGEQFASLNSAGEIVGYVAARYRRETESVSDLQFLSFTEGINHVTARDMLHFIDTLFSSRIRKISFDVVCGNPIEPTYEKLVKRYGGRVVGIMTGETRLVDGGYYDTKLFEILKSDYDRMKKKKSEVG